MFIVVFNFTLSSYFFSFQFFVWYATHFLQNFSGGYPVVAINPNNPEVQPEDSYDLMVARAKEKSYPFPYLFDEGQKVFPVFGAAKTPHVFLLNKKGKDIVVEYIGTIDDNYKDASMVKEKYLENAVDALLAGKMIALKETKAVGCGIKVKR